MALSLIVLTNFYQPGQRAVHYADALASALGAQLVLLHVNRASLYDPYVFVGEDWRREELNREATTSALLAQLANQLLSPATVELATDLLPEVAQDLVTRHQPALFVLGLPAPGQGGDAAQLTTAALELLRAARFPVLLVPAGPEPPCPPRRVLVAADREAFGLDRSARAVELLLRGLGAALTVAYVSPVEDDAGCTMALEAVQRSGLAAGSARVELQGYLHANPTLGVLEAIDATQAELVVLQVRARSYLGELFHRSVTAQVVARSQVPVLAVPVVEPAAGRPAARRAVDDGLLWPDL
ncbi:hypothetical protein GCM10027048_21140 [Hymenobacter coalescens]